MLPSVDVVSFHTETVTIVDPVLSKCFFSFLFKNIQFVERLRVKPIFLMRRAASFVCSIKAGYGSIFILSISRANWDRLSAAILAMR